MIELQHFMPQRCAMAKAPQGQLYLNISKCTDRKRYALRHATRARYLLCQINRSIYIAHCACIRKTFEATIVGSEANILCIVRKVKVRCAHLVSSIWLQIFHV